MEKTCSSIVCKLFVFDTDNVNFLLIICFPNCFEFLHRYWRLNTAVQKVVEAEALSCSVYVGLVGPGRERNALMATERTRKVKRREELHTSIRTWVTEAPPCVAG